MASQFRGRSLGKVATGRQSEHELAGSVPHRSADWQTHSHGHEGRGPVAGLRAVRALDPPLRRGSATSCEQEATVLQFGTVTCYSARALAIEDVR